MTDLIALKIFLNRIEPSSFLLLVNHLLGEQWPVPDRKRGKRASRAALLDEVLGAELMVQQQLNDVSEKLLLLADSAGKDAVQTVSDDLSCENDRKVLRQCSNQYERSLWLYIKQKNAFEEALERREVLILERSSRTCKGFKAGKQGLPSTNLQIRQELIQELSALLKCPSDEIALSVFEREPDEEGMPGFYDIHCHYNRAPESRDKVNNSQLESIDLVWAESIYFRYLPDAGSLHVMARKADAWKALARTVSEKLLDVSFTGEEVTIQKYDIKRMGDKDFLVDLSISPRLLETKITYLDWRSSGKGMILTSSLDEAGTVYIAGNTMARRDISPSRDNLHKAVLSARVKAEEPGGRNRTINIAVTGRNRCSIRCTREQDKALAMLILRECKIVRELDDDKDTVTAHNTQAIALF